MDDLLRVALGKDVLDGLVGVGDVLLNRDVVLDLHEDDGEREDEGSTEQGEVADVLGAVGQLAGIEVVDDGGTDGLDALVETDEVGRAATRVGQRTHEPEEKRMSAGCNWIDKKGVGTYQ